MSRVRPLRDRDRGACGPGMLTTVQDWPGRIGYWQVGVPPSGPDGRPVVPARQPGARQPGGRAPASSARVPVRRCVSRRGGRVCVTGAPVPVTVDGVPVPQWQPVTVPAGAVLDVGDADRARAALLRAGRRRAGANPNTSGSTATFTLGRFGGHDGRALRDGDVLTAGIDPDPATGVPRVPAASTSSRASGIAGRSRSPKARTPRRSSSPAPTSTRSSAPTTTVHFNSDRTGVRLIGPEAAVGAHRRRRGRPAPVQHPRQRLLRRRSRLHRRHPDPARPRRAEPRRVRLPGRPWSAATAGSSARWRPGDTVRFVPVRADGRRRCGRSTSTDGRRSPW